jgi:hypothetical protein
MDADGVGADGVGLVTGALAGCAHAEGIASTSAVPATAVIRVNV